MYKDITLGFEFEVEGTNSAICDLIDKSSHITGITEHLIEEYHDTRYKTAQGKWRIEEDETIDGAEFISPPTEYYKAKESCKAFFEAIKNTPNTKTSNACGLHVGMSINGVLDNVDLTNIIPNINQRLLVKLWPDRMLGKHCYCNNLKNMIKEVNIFEIDNLPNISSISKTWLNSTYAFIKTKEYDGIKYIEFRVPGGKDYHFKFNELFISIDHISDILLGHTKLSKKRSIKKMYSYLNRVCKKTEYSHFISPLALIYSEKLSKNEVSTASFNAIYISIISKITNIRYQTISSKKLTRKDLNKNNYLFFVLKYMVVNNIYSRLLDLSNTINNRLIISIPENIQQSDMIKMLKVWELLPANLVRNLLIKLNQRSYNYFIKYYINSARNSEQRDWVLNVCKHDLNNITPSF